MFSYLSKKISIPNNKKIISVSWSKEHGYIACGGEDGILKILKLEVQNDSKYKGLAAQSNLVMNQTLEGHADDVKVIIWNEKSRKLTSSDQSGLIIVWILYKGAWYEEMINNRNKSSVQDMKWDYEGQKICIVYKDGAAIVGSVDGNRIWGKELKFGGLIKVEWSPDGSTLLFGLLTGEVCVFDACGNFLSKMITYCLSNIHGAVQIASLDWYKAGMYNGLRTLPSLALCYDIGRCQLMRSHDDTDPVLLNTGIQIACSSWNEDGSMLAVAGAHVSNEHNINVVQFYNPLGDHLRTLCLPGKCLSACTWEGNGSLRIALAVDSFLYFANLRPHYKWAYCSAANTIIYSYSRPHTFEHSITFWNLKTSKTKIITVRHLIDICASEDCVCLICKPTDSNQGVLLIIHTSVGVAIESKHVPFEPTQSMMTSNQVILINKSFIYAWQYFTPKQILDLGFTFTPTTLCHRDGIERLYHIDTISMKTLPTDLVGDDNISSPVFQTNVDWSTLDQPISSDPICTLVVNKSTRNLFIARESGFIQVYRLPDLHFEMKFSTCDNCPYRIYINCNATCLGVIDESGIFRLHLIPNNSNHLSSSVKFENIANFIRKDVWDVKFEEDNPDMFAIMEKTRMYIFDGLQAEPAIQTSTFLYEFKDMEVKGVLLDELVKSVNIQPNEEFLLKTPIKKVKDFKQLLQNNSLENALEFIKNNPHCRLRRLLIDDCLEKQDLDMAELQFVHLQEYSGIQFIKRLRNIQSKLIRKAEILVYLKKYDEAETLLLNNDRSDLAVELRKRLGDWFRVAQLTKDTGVLVKDLEQAEIYNALGDHFLSQMLWDKAADYYQQGNDLSKCVECLYQMEDYKGIERIIEKMPDCHNSLYDFGLRLANLGMIQQAVYALVKSNHRKEAIDICLRLNQWRIAYELAKYIDSHDTDEYQQHSHLYQKQSQQKRIDNLLNQSVNYFIEQGRIVEAIELYKHAGRFLDAAELLYKEVQNTKRLSNNKPLYMKKIYVLIGLLVEQYYEQNKLQADVKPRNSDCGEGVLMASSTLAGLLLTEQDHNSLNCKNADSIATIMNYKNIIKQNDSIINKESEILQKTKLNELTNKLSLEQFNNSTKSLTSDVQLTKTSEISRLIDQPWRGAEAYHYLMLTEKQLYSGSINRAFRTAQLLKDYEDILNPLIIHSLIALCAIYTRNYATCSKAFIKLENLTDILTTEQKEIKELTLELFSRYQPVNEQNMSGSPEIDSMLESETKIPICIVTGQPITDYQFWMCPTCKHCAYENEITRLHNCPLCHSPVQ
ncbi:WD repeat-containing protein 35 [Schistosoma japonicum]|nr:WD repeat-containing protein 35 [Schistosoma japonicum]